MLWTSVHSTCLFESVLRSFGKMFEEPNSCLPPQLHHLASPPAVHKGSYFSTSCQHLLAVFFRNILTALGLPHCSQAPSSCSVLAPRCSGFSSEARLLVHRLQQLRLRLSCSAAGGVFSDQGPSPALAGRFSSAVPPGKSYFHYR